MSEQFQYIVITSDNYTTVQLDEFDKNAVNYRQYARWNTNLTKYIIKCSLSTPACFQNHTRYTKTELEQAVLTDEEWNNASTYNTGSWVTSDENELTAEQENALDYP